MAKKPDTRTDEEKRSYTMSRIRSKATSIEIRLQKALWHRGVRYRKNYRKIPGAPDIAIVNYKIAIFCDGDFWHGKDWEQKKARLNNNREYWISKIERNMERDKRFSQELIDMGWQVVRFWESDIKADVEACVDIVLSFMQEDRPGLRYPEILQLEKPLMVAEESEKQ